MSMSLKQLRPDGPIFKTLTALVCALKNLYFVVTSRYFVFVGNRVLREIPVRLYLSNLDNVQTKFSLKHLLVGTLTKYAKVQSNEVFMQNTVKIVSVLRLCNMNV